MKTQLTSLGVLVAGVVMLGALQACAPTEPIMEPTVAETAPTRSAEAPAREIAPPPADALKSAPESPAVRSAVEAVPSSPIATEPRNDKPLPPARSMTDLTVQRTKDRLVVLITGDGELTYDITKLNGNRLVIDLLNVVNGTKRQAVPVGHQFMRQIRIGVHQSPQAKVRLVLDLGRTVPFIIEKTGAQLRVTLSEQALAVQAPQGTQTVTRSVPGPAEVGAGGASAGPPPATNVASMTPRRSVPVPVPERLKFLDPMTSLAQPKPDQPTDIGGLRRPQPMP